MTDDALIPILSQLAKSRNDNLAWEALYTTLWPVIVATLSRRHSLPAIQSDDLAQEVMVRLLKTAKFSGVSASQFRSYVNAVCRSVAIDYLRGLGKRGQDVPYEEPKFESSLIHEKATVPEVRSVLAELSEPDKLLLDLVLAGHHPQEIALELNAPVGTVYVRLHRLRRRLREALKPKL